MEGWKDGRLVVIGLEGCGPSQPRVVRQTLGRLDSVERGSAKFRPKELRIVPSGSAAEKPGALQVFINL